MKTLIFILLTFLGFAYAWPGGCDMSSVSNKEWKLAKPLDASKLVFADYGISTKPTFSRYLLKKAIKSSFPQRLERPVALLEEQECGLENVKESKIVGGTEAKEHQFPWMVGTEVDGFIFCGASLISPKWVLTAAHCADNAIYVNLHIGAHNVFSGTNNEPGRLEICADNTITHPNFDFPNYDITLIELPVAVTYSPTVSPVCLPPRADTGIEYDGQEMTAVGWGYKSNGAFLPEDTLRMVDQLPVISDAECQAVYSADLGETYLCVDSVFNGQGGHGTCNGDSGGPLVRKEENGRWEQVGIVSFGSTNCEEGAPDGFTQVNLFLDWIEEQTGIIPPKKAEQ